MRTTQMKTHWVPSSKRTTGAFSTPMSLRLKPQLRGSLPRTPGLAGLPQLPQNHGSFRSTHASTAEGTHARVSQGAHLHLQSPMSSRQLVLKALFLRTRSPFYLPKPLFRLLLRDASSHSAASVCRDSLVGARFACGSQDSGLGLLRASNK